MQNVCQTVIKDAFSLPAGENFHFPSNDVLFNKEVRLNMLSISKVSNQSLPFVESALTGILNCLISVMQASGEGKNLKVRLNFKVGYLHI